MNNKVVNALMFISGAAIGAVVTWKVVETKYKRIAQEEIDSVKEVYSRRNRENDKPNVNEYKQKVDELKYNVEKNEEGGEEDMTEKPYVISPDEFGEEDGYSTVSLTYFADGVLVNDANQVIREVDEFVGEESLTHFGEYEDDSVFVRNHKMLIDFEILKDLRKWSEVEPLMRKDVEQLHWWDKE